MHRLGSHGARIHKHIHKTIRKHAPKSVAKARRLSAFKYPKLLLLVLSIVASYFLFTQPVFNGLMEKIDGFSHIGVFISGILISFGFSAPFGVGFLLNLHPSSLIFAGLIGGFGAMIGDLLIFRTIKNSFMGEFHELNKTHVIKKIEKIVAKHRHVLVRHYLLYIFAGLLIAAPVLPDEIGVSMLAGLTTIKPRNLAAISFVLHSIAVFLVLSLGLAI